MEKRETKISFAFFSLPSTFYGRKWDFSSSVFSYFYYFSALLSDPLFPSGKEKEKKYKAFFSFRKIVNSRQIPPVKERDLLLLVPLPPSFSHLRIIKKCNERKWKKEKRSSFFAANWKGKVEVGLLSSTKGGGGDRKPTRGEFPMRSERKKRCLFVFPLCDGCRRSTLVFSFETKS